MPSPPMDPYGHSCVESGGSSPRSDFDNPPPPIPSWEDQPPPPPQPPPHHKVKLMVSYGGKIQPRHHDNLLSYVGGETKILYVDRSISFPSLISKLSSIVVSDDHGDHRLSLPSFKYQLPDEDLDSLISVSNDEDLLHFMHEYDRLYRASPKPARLRIFLFPAQPSRFGSGSSVPDPDNKVDFLFGLDNRTPVQPNRVIGSDTQFIQDLNRLQISARKIEGNFAGESHKKPPPPMIPVSAQAPASYWKTPAVTVEHQQQQPGYNYVVQAPPPASVYHALLARPPSTQGYYQVQQVAPEPVYREQPVYNMAPETPLSVSPAPEPMRIAGYSDGMCIPSRPVASLLETTGRQVYYATPGAGSVGEETTSFQGTPGTVFGLGGDMRAVRRLTGVHGITSWKTSQIRRKKRKTMINSTYQYC